MKYVLALAVFGATTYIVATIVALAGRQRAEIGERLGSFVRRGANLHPPAADPAEAPEPAPSPRHRLKEAVLEGFERRLARRSFARDLARRLRRADLRLRVSEYLILTALCGGLGTVGGKLAGLPPVLRLAAGFAALWLPSMYVSTKMERRLKAFNNQLPDALGIMSNSLRSGYSLLQAIDVVAAEMPAPIGPEFAQVLRETRVSISVEDALTNLVERVNSPDLDLVVTAILIQRQVGGNLTEVLDKIGYTIRERIRILGEIRTLTTQGRISGIIISLLPVALALFMYLTNPGFIGPLFSHPLGRLMLGMAAFMQLLGVLAIRSLIHVEI